jgi:hypothetical protein
MVSIKFVVDNDTLSVYSDQLQGLCSENVTVGRKIGSTVLRPNV